MQYAFLPIFLFVACTIGLAVGLLIVTSLLNPGRPGRVTRMPYESGMDPIHDTRRRFDVRFHLLAIAFLVFDVELLFLYPWAVAFGGGGTSVAGGGWRVAGDRENTVGAAVKLPHQHGSANSQSPIPNPSPSTHHPPPATRHLVFAGVMTFLALLALGYVYDWRKGVFQWR